MSTEECYQTGISARSEILTRICGLSSKPISQEKGRLRASSMLNLLLLKIGLELQALVNLEGDLYHKTRREVFCMDHYVQLFSKQDWLLSLTMLVDYFAECDIASDISQLKLDRSHLYQKCENCDATSKTGPIWYDRGRHCCDTCYQKQCLKCDNCQGCQERYLGDPLGVKLEEDEDDIYYCLTCWDGFSEPAQSLGPPPVQVLEPLNQTTVKHDCEPTAIISSNNRTRLLECLSGVRTSRFSETILHSLEQADNGDPLALYGEILYLLDGSGDKTMTTTVCKQPLWKPCRECVSYYRPTYLDDIVRIISNDGSKRDGDKAKDPVECYSVPYLTSQLIDIRVPRETPSHKMERQRQLVIRHCLKALKSGVSKGTLVKRRGSYRLANGVIINPQSKPPECQLCVKRFHAPVK